MSVDLEPDFETTGGEFSVIQEDREGYELVGDKWVEKPVSNQSAIVGGNLQGVLHVFNRQNHLGLLLNPEGAYRLPGLTKIRIRKPDVSFVAAGRMTPTRDQDGHWPIAPDLAVEVISPTDIADDVEAKLDEYLRAGVRLVWMVYLPTRNVWAYRPDGTARQYRQDAVLTGEDVLPGFTVKVAELFEGL